MCKCNNENQQLVCGPLQCSFTTTSTPCLWVTSWVGLPFMFHNMFSCPLFAQPALVCNLLHISCDILQLIQRVRRVRRSGLPLAKMENKIRIWGKSEMQAYIVKCISRNATLLFVIVILGLFLGVVKEFSLVNPSKEYIGTWYRYFLLSVGVLNIFLILLIKYLENDSRKRCQKLDQQHSLDPSKSWQSKGFKKRRQKYDLNQSEM